MKALIKITEQDGKKVTSAKEMYDILGLNPAHFARWTKKNVVENPFAIEGEDWIALTIMVNGREFKDYALTIPFAERIAMTVKTDKGEQVRLFFQVCRDKLEDIVMSKTTETPQVPQTMAEALKLAWEQAVKIEEQQALLEEQSKTIEKTQPKADYFDCVLESETSISTTDIAIEFGTTAAKFNRFLNEQEVIKRSGKKWIPRVKYSKLGYMDSRTNLDDDGNSHIHFYWTERGRHFLHDLVNECNPNWDNYSKKINNKKNK